MTKSKRIFSEDFDVVVDGNIIAPEKVNDVQDDQRFNTEKHHKKQHKFWYTNFQIEQIR